MREITHATGQHGGFYATLREDSDFITRSSSSYALTELTPEAQAWLDENISYYNIDHGMMRCWIHINLPDERMHFKLRWYK